MQLIYDNIVASMVGATVLLIMLSAHMRNQVASAEATAYYMLQQQVIDFTGVLQRDMQNLSSVVDVTETDNKFRFWAQTELADTTKKLVTYQREYRGTMPTADGDVAIYQIERLVNGVDAGGSIATISDWSIVALNEDEAEILAPGDAAGIRINLAALPPVTVGKNEGIIMNGTRWSATYRPQLLRVQEL